MGVIGLCITDSCTFPLTPDVVEVGSDIGGQGPDQSHVSTEDQEGREGGLILGSGILVGLLHTIKGILHPTGTKGRLLHHTNGLTSEYTGST